jgi:succinoglycan biosynthesis transport protein ExoP
MRETNDQISVVNRTGDLSARDFLMPLFRRKRLVTVTFLAVLAAVILLAVVLGPAYSSRMEILVNRERLDPLVSTEATTQILSADNPVTPEEINSEVELLSSRDVLEQVVLANHLDKPDGFSLEDLLIPWQTPQDRTARAVKRLAKKLQIENIKNSNLIEITYKSSDPQRSYAVLKSLGDLYVAKHVAVHRPAGSLEFFTTETQKYHDELQDAESKLRNFGLHNAVAAPDQQRVDLSTQAADSVGLLHQAEQAVAADEERIKNDRQQLSATPQRMTTLQASGANEKLIDSLRTALLAAQNKRTKLVIKFNDDYPLVREADQEIAEDQAAVAQAEQKRDVTETTDFDPTYELLREDLAKAQSDLAAQRATVAATQHSVHSIRGEMVNLDQLSLTQQDLQREAKAAESNYLLYLAKREQERTSNALDVTRIANVAIAVPPSIPVLPVFSWPMIGLLGLCSAMVLGVGAAYTTDYLDRSFHTPAQVVEIIGIPVLAALPISTRGRLGLGNFNGNGHGNGNGNGNGNGHHPAPSATNGSHEHA